MYQRSAAPTKMSLILILLSIQILQAQIIHPVGIMLKDETHFSAQLLEADAQTYLIYNIDESCQQFVERVDVLYMESNLDVDLRELAASTDANQCRDRVYLTNGNTIACVVLEMTSEWIAYSINGELNRHVARSESVEMVRLGQNGMMIPWSGTHNLGAL